MLTFVWLLIATSPIGIAKRVSTSARCGPIFGLTCKGSKFGNCCSQYSYCGSTEAYCGQGCQSTHGDCTWQSSSVSTRASNVPSASRIISSSRPSSTLKLTTNGRCGSLYNASPKDMTCTGSKYGDCCSQYSYCGSTDAYCGKGCQQGFGACSPTEVTPSYSTRAASTSARQPISSAVERPTSSSSGSVSSSQSPSPVSGSSVISTVIVVSSTLTSSISIPSSTLSSTQSIVSPLISSTSSTSAGLTSLAGFSSTSSQTLSVESSTTAPQSSIGVSPRTTSSGLEPPTSIPSSSSQSVSVQTSFTSSPSLTSDASITVVSSSSASSDSGVVSSASSSIVESLSISYATSTSMTSIPSSILSSQSSDPSGPSSTLLSMPATSSAVSTDVASSQDLGTSTIAATASSSTMVPPDSVASSAVSSAIGCTVPKPSPTCDKSRDCPVSANLIASPSATYSVPVVFATATSNPNITVSIDNLSVGEAYVLTSYATETSLLGSGSHSCCNLTSYMDDVIVSQNCVGYYWGYTYVRNGAYSDSRFKWPRSPAIVYRPTVPNPKLTFNVVCPINSNGVLVNSVSMYGVSLAPRCTCQEENKFQSLQSQPFNNALNGNFADYDLSQENPVSGWTSQETWRGFVIPVQYTGPMSADDKSNNGAVVLLGPYASLSRPIENLVPYSAYNVSIQWWSEYVSGNENCNLTLKFDDQVIMAIPKLQAYAQKLLHNSTTVFPQSTSGVLSVGSSCARDFIYNVKSNNYPSMRIDDVSFALAACVSN